MRYFFHYLAGDTRIDDDEGVETADAAALRAEAVRAAREIMTDALRRDEPLPVDAVIEITDERGWLVAQVPLTQAAFGLAPESLHRRIFDSAPHGYMLLARDFTIMDANDSHLRATMTELGAIVRRPLFRVFPENPDDADRQGVRAVVASLHTVLRDRVAHAVPSHRYDILRRDGVWEKR
jgi:PAS domain-containing protein